MNSELLETLGKKMFLLKGELEQQKDDNSQQDLGWVH